MPDDEQSPSKLTIEAIRGPWHEDPPHRQNIGTREQKSDISSAEGNEYFVLMPGEDDPFLAAYNLLAPLFGKPEATHGLSEHYHMDSSGTEFIETNNGFDPEVETVAARAYDEEFDEWCELPIHFSIFIVDPYACWAVSIDDVYDARLLKTCLENQPRPIQVSIGKSVTIRDLKKQIEKVKTRMRNPSYQPLEDTLARLEAELNRLKKNN